MYTVSAGGGGFLVFTCVDVLSGGFTVAVAAQSYWSRGSMSALELSSHDVRLRVVSAVIHSIERSNTTREPIID